MGEQVKERLGSLTTMAINHHKACTFRISSKNTAAEVLKFQIALKYKYKD